VPVEQPRGGQSEGASAHRDDPRAATRGGPQRLEHRLGRPGVRGVAGHDDGVGVGQDLQAVTGLHRVPARGWHPAGHQRGRGERVPLLFVAVPEHLRRDGQVEHDDVRQGQPDHQVHPPQDGSILAYPGVPAARPPDRRGAG